MSEQDAFSVRLRRVVDAIAEAGRAHTEALVDALVNAGATSDAALLELVRDRSVASELRANGCWLLGRLASPGASDALVSLLADPSAEVRGEAAASLGLVGTTDSPVTDALIDVVVRDPGASVRASAIHALGILGGRRAVPTLLALVEDRAGDAALRADAAEACAHMTGDRIVPVLIGALSDASPLVRYSAAYALGQQGDANAVAPLEQLTGDDAVTPWGTVASSARQALEALMQRDD